jgi:hypothetical protein
MDILTYEVSTVRGQGQCIAEGGQRCGRSRAMVVVGDVLTAVPLLSFPTVGRRFILRNLVWCFMMNFSGAASCLVVDRNDVRGVRAYRGIQCLRGFVLCILLRSVQLSQEHHCWSLPYRLGLLLVR